jgi:DNA mismatch repair ATPase MutS
MELGDGPGPLRECVETLWSLLHAPDVASLEDGLGQGARGPRVFVLDRTAREIVAPSLERLIAVVHEIDALAAVARAAHEHGWVFPTVVEGNAGFRVDGLRHPFLEAPVPSDVDLGPDGRLIFLTGPNMAGKTTWLKAVGVTALLAHAGMPVPAGACRLGRMDRIISAIRTEDDLRGGVSYFQAEARRVRTIAEPVAEGLRCLVIVDELFRGTNVKDACDASLTVVRAFARASGCRFLIASHLTELATELADLRGVVFLHFEARFVDGEVAFDYRIRPGVSAQRLGMKVLEREGVVGTLERIPAGAGA